MSYTVSVFVVESFWAKIVDTPIWLKVCDRRSLSRLFLTSFSSVLLRHRPWQCETCLLAQSSPTYHSGRIVPV